jgi:CitMHS family citrate-Mg2+:H+ or citrate-Ca2+:H+ symporter
MSLAMWGTLTISALLVTILTKKLSPLIALFAIPVLCSLGAGFGFQTGTFVVDGVRAISPVIGMFVFAILFFGIVTDAGVLEPALTWLLRHLGSRPSRIVPGSALVALLIHLDGSGAVVFLVTIPAFLPLYRRIGIDPRILACVTSLAAGVNFLPWTGPTLRAAAALQVSPVSIFRPLLLVQVVGLIFVFAVSWILGVKEERRLAIDPATVIVPKVMPEDTSDNKLPRFYFLNVITIILVLIGAISGRIEPVVAFMTGMMVVLLINYRSFDQQKARISAHAPNALLMCSVLFSAGALSGVLKGTGMLAAMATASAKHIPSHAMTHLPVALGIVSMPLSLVFDPDSFYLGVLPLLAKIAAPFGVLPIKLAQAALLGQMTTGFPISPLTPATFLVVGLSEISLAEHQRFTAPYLFLATVLMTVTAVVFGILPL